MPVLLRTAAALATATCLLVGPSATIGSTAEPTTPTTSAASASRDGHWEKFGPSNTIRGRYWSASKVPQKRFAYRLKRRASSHGKRQVRLRWQSTRADPLGQPKPGRWHAKTRGIRPGGHRHLGFHVGGCGNQMLWVDLLTRRKQPRHPKRWGKWEYLVASSYGRECGR